MQTIMENFAGQKVAMAREMENWLIEKVYNITFTNGDKLEFDGQGNWTEISCPASAVPAGLVPAAIRHYVDRHYPDTPIIQILRYRKEYDVELTTGLMLLFNTDFQVVETNN